MTDEEKVRVGKDWRPKRGAGGPGSAASLLRWWLIAGFALIGTGVVMMVVFHPHLAADANGYVVSDQNGAFSFPHEAGSPGLTLAGFALVGVGVLTFLVPLIAYSVKLGLRLEAEAQQV